MAESHNLGKDGEAIASDYLGKKGYRILHRNWVWGKKEIDIIAENKDFIVFAEVKTRSRDMHLRPGDLVPREKQRYMIFAAEGYIKRYNINKESRFDVITIISGPDLPEIEHIENAFYPTLR
ncbi:MAG: YraN family protein [Bacteroidales bacterium]